MSKRVTRQRTAILRCLSQEGHALTIDEILTGAAKEIPHLNLSTIYRAMKALIAEGRIQEIELPGKKLCYEICQAGHHHYFVCDGCGKNYQIYQCPKGLLDMVPKGFILRGHSIVLNGLCLRCQGHSEDGKEPV